MSATAITSLCCKCGLPIGSSSLLIGGRIYHHECSPYASRERSDMVDVASLRKLAGKATPGKRAFDGNCGGYITESGDKIARAYSADDAAYIAACDPQTILALLDENERLRKALAWMENLDPQLVSAAEEKFGFELFPAHP